MLRLFRRLVPMTEDYRGGAFIVLERGRRLATPLLAVLVAVETTKIMAAARIACRECCASDGTGVRPAPG